MFIIVGYLFFIIYLSIFHAKSLLDSHLSLAVFEKLPEVCKEKHQKSKRVLFFALRLLDCIILSF